MVVTETHGVVGPTWLRVQWPGHKHSYRDCRLRGPLHHVVPATPLLGQFYLDLGARKQARGRICF